MNKAQKFVLLKNSIKQIKDKHALELAPLEKEFEQLKKEILGLTGGDVGQVNIDGGVASVSILRRGHESIKAETLREVLAHPVAGPIVAPFVTKTKDALTIDVVVIN